MVTSRKLSKYEVDFIQNLQNSHIRKGIIADPSKDDIRIIRNLRSNVCRGNFKFNENQRQKLIPHAKLFRILGDPNRKQVKKEIALSGNALSILAPLLVALIKLVTKKMLRKVVAV
jgi:hypothetical protein